MRAVPTVVLAAALFSGCGSNAHTSSSEPSTTAGATTATTTTTTASTAPITVSTTAASSTTSFVVTTSTVAAPRLTAGTMTLPTGDLVAGPGDLFVVHSDGDLWLHPGALTSAPGNPVRLADLTDPRIPWGPEGSGPNTVEDVAGEVDGVVYYSDCCEPIMGDLLAATSESSERILLGAGYSPVLDPTRIKLATVNNNELAVIDLTNGEYRGLVLNDPGAWIEPWDLIWTPDGTALVVLSFENAEWGLTRFAAAPPFEQGEKVPLGLAFDPAAGFDVQIAGRGPNGEIAVVVDDDKATVLRYFDPTTLAEVSGPQPSLPPNIRSVRLADDGVSLLWVDNTTLRYLPAGGDTRDLGDGFVAAWFA